MTKITLLTLVLLLGFVKLYKSDILKVASQDRQDWTHDAAAVPSSARIVQQVDIGGVIFSEDEVCKDVLVQNDRVRSVHVPVRRLVAGTAAAFTRPEDEVCKDLLVQNDRVRSVHVPVRRLVAGTAAAFTRPEDEVCKDVLVQNDRVRSVHVPVRRLVAGTAAAFTRPEDEVCKDLLVQNDRVRSVHVPVRRLVAGTAAAFTRPEDEVCKDLLVQNDLVRSVPQVHASVPWLDQSDMPLIEKGRLNPVMPRKTTSYLPWLQNSRTDSGIKKSSKESKIEGSLFRFLVANF